jgi:hypothetical protein
VCPPGTAPHTDSNPKSGEYLGCFYAFPNDVEASKKFVQVLVKNRPTVAVALRLGGADAVARQMFFTGYYTGIHANNPEANIADYAGRLAKIYPRVVAELGDDWAPERASDAGCASVLGTAVASKGASAVAVIGVIAAAALAGYLIA